MTKGEKKFNELKDNYIKDYKRTTNKDLAKIFYKDGFVYIEHGFYNAKHRISKFEEMCAVLSLRKDFNPESELIKAKDVDPNKIYNIEYPWGLDYNKGVGRYQPKKNSQVYIITNDGGVTYCSPERVKFISEVGKVAI